MNGVCVGSFWLNAALLLSEANKVKVIHFNFVTYDDYVVVL